MVDQGWDALLASLGDVERRPPATPAALTDLEARLRHPLPADLRALLEQSDGVFDETSSTWVVWPVEQLLEERLRPTYPELAAADLLAVGTDGAGEWFCLPAGRDRPVLVWDPIEGEARPVADDLRHLVRGWVDGSLST